MINLAFWRAYAEFCGCMVVQESKESHGIQSALHMLMLKRMQLLRAGDVELNPGPEDEETMSSNMAVLVCGKTGAGKSSLIQAIITSEGPHNLPSTHIMHRSMVVGRADVSSMSSPPKDVNHGFAKGLSSAVVGSASSQGRYSTNTFASPESMSSLHASSPDFKVKHNTSLLYFIDTGGQPEFYDILPFLLPGKSQFVILYVINLSEDLNFHDFDIMHLMQLMNPKESTTPCKIAVIGTHKDHEHECTETRLQKNRKLREILNGLSVQDDHMVAYHGRHELIFPLNAKHLGLEDLQTVSKLKHMVLKEKLEALQDSITDTTLFLCLQLREQMKDLNRSVLRRSECFTIAQQLQFTESSFETALKDLNKHNIVLYYHDELPNVVLHQQVIIDKTVEIVESCHHLRNTSSSYSSLTSEDKLQKHGTLASEEKLQKHGIVTRELLTGFSFEEFFTEADLLKLLMNRLVVAECAPDEYLMPCLMPVVEFSEPLSSSRAPSLLLSFQSGEPPSGLFCAWICHLISHENWKLAIERESDSPTQLTRKRIQFISGEYTGAITLSEFRSFFEVNIALASDSLDCMLYSALCAKVRKDILKAVRIALSMLGYSGNKMPEEAFFCTRSSCTRSPHPAIIQSGYQWMKCVHNHSTEVNKLTSQHLQWFGAMHADLPTEIKEVLRETKIVKRPFIHCVLLGQPGCGKSAMINKLAGIPLETMKECSVRQWMVRVHDSECEVVDYDDEVHLLFQDDPKIQFLRNAFDQLSCEVGDGLKVTANFQTDQHGLKSPLDILKSALNKTVSSVSKNSFTLHITATGGQTEFQEVLPAFFSGPTIFLLLFPLDQDIGEKYSVDQKYSSGGGHSSLHYQASCTKDYLLRALATITSHFKIHTKRLPIKPQIFLVGTHQGLVSEEEISKIDCELQQLIKSSVFYQKGLVQVASETRLIMDFDSSLPVRMSSTVTQIHSVVKCLSIQEDFNCSVPRSWLMLDLILRQSKLPILSFDVCFGVAKECGIGTHDELEEALLFLSERIGSVKYQNMGDSESIVITDLQYTVEKITNIFYKSDAFAVNRGIIPFDSLQKLALTEELNPSILIRLLESLHLVNRIAVKGDATPEYFIPCLLPWTSLEDASEMQESHTLPLMIHFECGYIPMGFFGGVVAYLIGKSTLDWKLADEQAFRNRIRFCVGSLLATVTLVTHFADIEVITKSSCSKTRNLSDKSLFIEVRRCLEKCCEAVLRNLNLRNTFEYSFGFSCPEIGMNSETTPHAALVQFHQGQVDKLVCVHTQKIWDAPQQCNLWFGQEESTSGLAALVRVEADSPVVMAAKGHGGMTSLVKDLSNTAGRLLRSQDLKTLTEVLADVQTKWRSIGLALGLTQHNLEAVQRSPTVSPLSNVLKLWLQNPKQPTVEDLASVLQDIGEGTTAQRITEMFSHQRESPSMYDRPTLKDLAIIPIEVSQWYSLGIELGLQKDVLNSLEDRYSNPTRRKREMFRKWLEDVPDPSWSPLLTALERIGATDISELVRMEYNLPPSPPVAPPTPQPKEIEDVDAGFVDSEGLEPTELPNGETADSVLSPIEPPRLYSLESEEQNTDPWRADSPEYLAFKAHFDDLAMSLSTTNLTTFSSQVFSKSLISSTALQSVFTDLPPQQRAEMLLTSVEEKIQSDPESFTTLLQAVRHFCPDLCNNIASQLEKSVQVYQIFFTLQVMNPQNLDLDQLALKLLDCKLIARNVYDDCALQTQAIDKARGLFDDMLEQGITKPFLDILENFSNTEHLPEELKHGESPLSVTSGYATVSAPEVQAGPRIEIPPLTEVDFHAEATNDITRESSSADTFHSFNSDNGVAYFHSRNFTDETFSPVVPQQLLWKSSPEELVTTMAPVSSFSSAADVPSNSTVVETTQEAPELEIMRAFHCGDTATIKSLLQRCRVCPDSQLQGSKTLLMMAAEEDRGSVVTALLEHKASIDLTDGDGKSALHYASSAGNYEVMKMLVKEFANVNLLAKDGSSVLMKPSEKGFSMVVGHLLENGANPNLADKRGWTPLIAAASRDQKDVVKVLLQHGADVTVLSIEGSTTALYEAAKKKFADKQPQPNDTVGMLAAAMSKEVQKTQGLFTCKTVEDIRRLIKTGARIDSQRGDGCTPLIVHSERGHNDIVEELCKQGALIDTPDKNGVTALMKASHAGHLDVVRTLLFREAWINLSCRRGLTALMYAVLGNHLRVVKELMTAQAELKTRDKDGRTALEIAIAKGYTEIAECLERASPKSTTSNDPFNQLLGSYLDKVDKGKTGAPETVPAAAAKTSSPHLASRNKANGSGPHREEYNTQNEQLVKAWKRIADLETRIHDLTLQATMEPPKEEDLSYLERPRLESEYLKLKEQKKKAEHYAIEAKQTAQRLSAENFKLKENLSKERHDYDFSKKDMLREMENQRRMQSSAKDTAEAKLEVIDEEVKTRALQLMQSTLRKVRAGSISEDIIGCSPETSFNQNDVLEIIKQKTFKGNFVLLAFTGLPKSGKSTLTRAMLGDGASGSLVQSSLLKDSNFYKAAFTKDLTHHDANWLALTLADIHIIIISLRLSQIAALTQSEPRIEKLLGGQQPQLKDKLVNDTFQSIFENIQDTLTKLRGAAALTGTSVSFCNIWDIGTNKALVEVLQRLGRNLGRLLIVNVLNLRRDADHMSEPPDLEGCEEDKTFMKRRSRVHYSMRMAGIPANKSISENAARVLYVLTHADKFEDDEERDDAVKKVRNAVYASAAEAGVSETLHSKMLSIDATQEDDTNMLKTAIEEMVKRFEYDMPLRWVFFRAVLSQYAKENDTFCITREKFNDIAHNCWMKTDDDIEEFVKVHRDGCSILSCPDIPVLQSNIIIDPMRFLQGFEKLYYANSLVSATQSESIRKHSQRSFKEGIFCKTLAKSLWGDDADLYLEVLEYSGFMTNLSSYKERCRFCDDPACYFVPTLRAEMWEEEPSPESLFITCNTDYIELQLQSQFVRRIPTYFPNVSLNKVTKHNAISFKLSHHYQKVITIDVVFHNDAVEVRVRPPLDDITTIGEVYSKLKTLSVEIFDEVSVRMPSMRFGLAVVCPNSNSDSPMSRRNIHYMPFHICAVSTKELFCSFCKSELPVSPEEQLWINAAYMGPMSSAIAQYDCLTPSDLEKVADALFENSEVSCPEDFLGISAREMKQLLGLRRRRSLIHQLNQQQERSECRTKQCFAKALLKAGCYSEALQLDPRLLGVDLQGDTDDVLLERELAIAASHISDWEQLAHSLNVAECVCEIQEKYRRSRSECCLRMLRVWYQEYTSCRRPETPRAHLIRQLKESGYFGVANFLITGENDTYIK